MTRDCRDYLYSTMQNAWYTIRRRVGSSRVTRAVHADVGRQARGARTLVRAGTGPAMLIAALALAAHPAAIAANDLVDMVRNTLRDIDAAPPVYHEIQLTADAVNALKHVAQKPTWVAVALYIRGTTMDVAVLPPTVRRLRFGMIGGEEPFLVDRIVCQGFGVVIYAPGISAHHLLDEAQDDLCREVSAWETPLRMAAERLRAKSDIELYRAAFTSRQRATRADDMSENELAETALLIQILRWSAFADMPIVGALASGNVHILVASRNRDFPPTGLADYRVFVDGTLRYEILVDPFRPKGDYRPGPERDRVLQEVHRLILRKALGIGDEGGKPSPAGPRSTNDFGPYAPLRQPVFGDVPALRRRRGAVRFPVPQLLAAPGPLAAARPAGVRGRREPVPVRGLDADAAGGFVGVGPARRGWGEQWWWGHHYRHRTGDRDNAWWDGDQRGTRAESQCPQW